MTQETKSILVYALVAIGITLAIAGVAQVSADLAFGLIVTFMAFSVVWFVVHAIRTWSEASIFLRWLLVMSCVGLFYWSAYLVEYQKTSKHTPVAHCRSGDQITFGATVATTGNASDGVTWSSSNLSVATIHETHGNQVTLNCHWAGQTMVIARSEYDTQFPPSYVLVNVLPKDF